MKKVQYIIVVLLIFALTVCSTGCKRGEKELIGRIVTYEDFLTEITKRINLEDYNCTSTDNNYIVERNYTCKIGREIAPAENNFQVQIDGIEFTLPITIKEFVALGFEIISMYGAGNVADLPAYARSASLRIKTPTGNTFDIYAISADYSVIPFGDLPIIQVSCDFYGDSIKYNSGEREDAPDIRFFENITGKSTVDSILKELKDPQIIYFLQSLDNDITRSTMLQFVFYFSNEKYNGSVCINTYAVLDESIAQTSYVTSISYGITYESLKNQ